MSTRYETPHRVASGLISALILASAPFGSAGADPMDSGCGIDRSGNGGYVVMAQSSTQGEVRTSDGITTAEPSQDEGIDYQGAVPFPLPTVPFEDRAEDKTPNIEEWIKLLQSGELSGFEQSPTAPQAVVPPDNVEEQITKESSSIRQGAEGSGRTKHKRLAEEPTPLSPGKMF